MHFLYTGERRQDEGEPATLLCIFNVYVQYVRQRILSHSDSFKQWTATNGLHVEKG